ncbi:MAG: glycosyltransferase [Acidimicrobiales bacterium]
MLDLSVIIPCRNVADTLQQQLDALAQQTWDGTWECVVVDNGSTDETAKVARGHVGLRGRLRVVVATQGRGVSYARNAGVRATVSRAVAFCDGDDIVAPGWVAAVGDALRTYPLVSGAIDVERLNTAALTRSRGAVHADRPPVFGRVTFLRGNNGGMQRTAWEGLGGFDERFIGLEDIEFSLRAAAAGWEVFFEPRALVHYRYRPEVGALWRQGLFYGRSFPDLSVRARRAGLQPPGRLAGVRSWLWLVRHVPKLATREERAAWLWVLANRIGVLWGSLRARSLHV